jgi:Dolichyl-phosphate-mannose-protein mannosyltransferase
MTEPVIISKASTNSPSAGLVGGIRARLARAVTSGRQWWWIGVATVAIAVGTLLRLYQLNLKPLHHDEGVNGFFLLGLFREGIYRYNAANYHGPTLYYFALITCSVNNLLTGAEGPGTVVIRVVPVLFGIGVLVLLLNLRHRLGDAGTLTAFVLAALSPGMVYISRDFIHEMLLVFFTLWLVVCGLQFWDTNKPRHLMLASIAAALMFCTKETALISIVALGLSAGFTLIWIPGHKKLNSTEWGGWGRITLLAVAWDQNFIVEADVFPADAAQFTLPQSGSEIQQHHYSLTLFQLTVDKLGKLINAEADGCCLAHAALPNRRNRIAVCPFIADCVLVQKMHQVPDLLFRTIG